VNQDWEFKFGHCDDADADALVMRRWRIRIRTRSEGDGGSDTPSCQRPKGTFQCQLYIQAFDIYNST
jgi:hypothetical protein